MTQKRDSLGAEILDCLFKNEAHVRGMERTLKIPHATLARKLSNLEKQNIVDYKIVGKNKQYFVKKNIRARKMLEIMENYKLLKLIEKYPLLAPVFEDITHKSGSKLAILFGSYAKLIPKPKSDIDVYVDTIDQNIKKEIEMVHSKLSVKIGKFNKDSLLIKEIIKNHVIIRGVERFYDYIFG